MLPEVLLLSDNSKPELSSPFRLESLGVLLSFRFLTLGDLYPPVVFRVSSSVSLSGITSLMLSGTTCSSFCLQFDFRLLCLGDEHPLSSDVSTTQRKWSYILF